MFRERGVTNRPSDRPREERTQRSGIGSQTLVETDTFRKTVTAIPPNAGNVAAVVGVRDDARRRATTRRI